jgi:adenylate cyclase
MMPDGSVRATIPSVAGDLRAFLLDAGATEAEVERATAEGWLPLLALDRMLMPERAHYDAAGVARAAGTTPDVAARIWRALGFPDVPEGVGAFSDRDARALRFVTERLEGSFLLPDLEHQVRVVSASLARLAAFEADLVADALDALRATGADEATAAMALVEEADWDSISSLIDYTHRLLFRAALWRRLARPNTGPTVWLAIAFADLAGYTELSEGLDENELSELLARFESLAYDTVAANNGRIVKTIGDEVMIVGTPRDVAVIALALVERVAADPDVPDVRVGVAYGSVLARDGDFYGPVVNLASRITGRARRGSVLASEPLHQVLGDDPEFSWQSMRPRRIRGIGEVTLWVLRRRR